MSETAEDTASGTGDALAALSPNPDWRSLPLFDRSNWTRLPFGDFAQNVNERVEPADAADEIYVGLEHLDSQNLHIRRWGKGSDVIGTKLRFRNGDIIFGRRRAYQRKLAVAEFDGICSAHAMVVRAKPDLVLPEFLPFLMMSDRFMNRAVEISVGSLSPTINWRTLKEEEFDLPPLEVQRRIAEVLWAVDEVKQLSIASSGSIDALHHAYVSDFFYLNNKNDNQLRFKQGWLTAQLQRVVQTDAPIRYGIVQVGQFCESGTPTVAIKNLRGEFGSDLHRTDSRIEARYAGSRIKAGDLLISIKATVGEVALVPEGFSGNISRDLARIRCNPDIIDPRVLFYLFRSDRYRSYIDKHVVGSTRKEISIHFLRTFEVPLPSKNEAFTFLLKMAELEHAKEAIENQIASITQLSNSLINVIHVSEGR